jgi:hypothetical protein
MGGVPNKQSKFAALVGNSLRNVGYAGAWREDPVEPGGYVEWLVLHFTDGGVVRITTDPECSSWGLDLYDGEVEDPLAVMNWWTPAPGDPWSSLLGAKLVRTRLLWQQDTDGGERCARLQAVVLEFDRSPAVYVAAACWLPERKLGVPADNVAVVFGAADALRCGLQVPQEGQGPDPE